MPIQGAQIEPKDKAEQRLDGALLIELGKSLASSSDNEVIGVVEKGEKGVDIAALLQLPEVWPAANHERRLPSRGGSSLLAMGQFYASRTHRTKASQAR